MLYIQFELKNEDGHKASPVFGPYNYIQATHTDVTVANLGADAYCLASYHPTGPWIMQEGLVGTSWTDFVVSDTRNFICPDAEFLTADALREAFESLYDEHPIHTSADWHAAVAEGSTKEGYWEWVSMTLKKEHRRT